MAKGYYHTYKLYMVPCNTNLATYNLVVPYFDEEIVKEWLKFWQNLEVVITGQSITDTQDMYMITNNLL
eukprot:14070493-Ditylum_brightwellii.AAC.1